MCISPLLKEWGCDSLGVLPEDTMQDLLMGIPVQIYFHYISSIFVLHLKQKAAQLKHEGLGQIKMALVGTDTSSLLEILQVHFGCVASSESDMEEDDLVEEEKTSEAVEEAVAEPKEVGNLATAKLVFPFAGISKMYLPLCGPKTLYHYHCQVLSCTLDFAQKLAACNHVHHDHLNVPLACLYCSFENNPKIHWYSTSAWEHHARKHLKDNLPIFPDNPTFPQQMMPPSSGDAVPSTLRQILPHEEKVRKWAQAAKCYFEEEQAPSQVSTPAPLTPETEGLRLSSLEPQAPKHHIKQGTIKSSKN